jgi:hypothetical protein
VTTPLAASGSGGSVSPPFNQVASSFDVYIGGSKATVAWAGLAPGFVGVYQLNVIPSGEAIGDVVIRCGTCSESNHVRMPQAPLNGGSNTVNVTGSVAILHPAQRRVINFSPAFVVAKVTARFDIKPNADRFTVSAVAKVGSTTVDGMTIQLDPKAGQFTASLPAPTARVRAFDFRETGITVMDFRGTCGTTNGCPMPGNVVPPALIDALLWDALRAVPYPNSPADGIHAFYTIPGTFTPSSTFIMDESNNLALTFASIGSTPYPATDVPVSVALYIDGQLVDVATSSYTHP